MTRSLTLIYLLCLISFGAQAQHVSHTKIATTGENFNSIPLLTAGTPAVALNGSPPVWDGVNKISALVISCVVDSNITCNGANNGYASVNANGGTPPYDYNWSNGDTTSSISNLIAGVYSVIVMDSLGITDTCEVTLTEPSGLSVILNATKATCGISNGTIDVIVTGGTPAYVYNWNNGQTTEDLMSLHPDTFTVTITDINGCSISGSTAIVDTGTAFANADILDTLIACGGEEIGLRGSIGGTASLGTWFGGLGQFPDGIHNLMGSYFPDSSEYGTSFPLLLITDDPPGICVADTDTVIITILMPPVLEPLLPVIACGGSFDLLSLSIVDSNNTLGQLYFYDSLLINQPLPSTIITSSGTYYILKVTNTNPSCFDIISVDITINPPLQQEIWTGAIDSSWNNAGNWICSVPDSTQDVIIPGGTIPCIIYSGQNGICKSLVVDSTASLFIKPTGKLEVEY